MIVYAIKSAVILSLLYWVFFALLSKETFHRFNRIVLLSIMLVSMVLPIMPHAIDVSVLPQSIAQLFAHETAMVEVGETSTAMATNVATTEAAETQSAIEMAHSLSVMEIVKIIYIAGLVGMIVVFLFQIISLMIFMRGGLRHTDSKGNTVVLKAGEVASFSFFRFIVMSTEDYEKNRESILLHEQEHISLKHTFDLVLLQAAKMLQWFNPFVWMLGRDLKSIHEFEADKAVLSHGIDATKYQYLLVSKSAGPAAFAIINGFNHSQLKSRIVMLNKKKTNPIAMGRCLVLLPVVFAAFVFTAKAKSVNADPAEAESVVAESTINQEPQDDVVFTVVEEQPEFPGKEKGLMEYIKNNIKYPESCVKDSIQGRVTLSFIVEKDGSVSNINEMRSPNPDLTAEAARLVQSMPKWNPGKQRGQAVRVKYVMPITFRLQ